MIDDEKQQFLLNDNNKVKESKIKEMENNLIEINNMLCHTKTDLENNILEANNAVVATDKELNVNYEELRTLNNELARANEKNCKLTSELVFSKDS